MGIEYIAAHSPQAKGRVERLFGTLQNRLIKEMRLRNIATFESANEYLKKYFIPFWNQRFAVKPTSNADLHRPLKGFDLKAILSVQEPRTVNNDYTLRYQNRVYQIEPKSIGGGLRKAKVLVEKRLNGTLKLRFRGRYLHYHDITSICTPKLKNKQEAKGLSLYGLPEGQRNERQGKTPCPSVQSPGAALGSLPSVALSSDQADSTVPF